MRYTATIFTALTFAGLIWAPPQIYAQSKEYKELQREFYDTNAKVDELSKAMSDRMGQLETMLKQVVDANAKLTEQLQALQSKVADAATQQDKRIVAPLDQIKKNQDDLWQAFQGVQGSLDNIKGRQDKMDGSLTNLTGTLSLMRDDLSKAAAPAPVSTSAAPASADAATIAFATAERDRLSGKLQLALQEFNDLATAYPNAPEAPMAFYEQGMMYVQNEQPEDAIKAFDRLLEQFGDTPMRMPAQFAKAEQLAIMAKYPEAVREYNNYAKLYPDDEKAAVAKERAAELSKATAGKKPAPPKNRRSNSK